LTWIRSRQGSLFLEYTESMKTTVYIDGQNFLYKASEILILAGCINNKQDLFKLDIEGIIKNIIKSEDLHIRFYGARVRVRKDKGDDIYIKSRAFSDNSRKLKNNINKQNIEYVESGKLKLRDSDICKKCGAQDLRFQEKGVDVGMAVDMIVDSFSVDDGQIVLVSSDTDLIPAIKSIVSRGTEITYLGFSDKLTKGIVSEASKTETIRDTEIIDAFNRLNPQTLLLSDS